MKSSKAAGVGKLLEKFLKDYFDILAKPEEEKLLVISRIIEKVVRDQTNPIFQMKIYGCQSGFRAKWDCRDNIKCKL